MSYIPIHPPEVIEASRRKARWIDTPEGVMARHRRALKPFEMKPETFNRWLDVIILSCFAAWVSSSCWWPV